MDVRAWARGAFDDARARVLDLKLPDLPAWWRGKDRAGHRAAARARTGKWLGWFVIALGFSAGLGEAGFMFLFVLRAVGDVQWTWRFEQTASSGVTLPSVDEWAAALTVHPLLFLLLFWASLVIVGFSLVWIPLQLAVRGHGRLTRVSIVLVGLFCNALVLAGGFHGQNTNRLEDIRDEVVSERQVASGVAALEDDLAAAQARLDDLMGDPAIASPSYQMQACRLGGEGWAGYVRNAAARNDPALAMIERAQNSAAQCDALRQERDDRQSALNEARREASSVISVRNIAASDEAAPDRVSTFIEQWRPLGVSLGLSFIAIFCFFWAQKLAEARALVSEDPALSTEAPPTEGAVDDASGADVIAGVNGSVDDEPPLAPFALDDWRDAPDEAFEQLSRTVDEYGRRQKRVDGYWRLDDDRPAPESKSDRRRSEARGAPGEQPEPTPEPQSASNDPAPDAQDIDDLIDDLMNDGARTPEPAQEV